MKILLWMVMFWLVGCGPHKGFHKGDLQLPEGPIAIPVTAEIVLAGSVFGTGETAVVLAHSFVLGQSRLNLSSFAGEIADAGFTVVTYDSRGYGETPGPPVYHEVDIEARAVYSLLRQHGFERIACMGIGLGGLACTKSGSEVDMAGLVLISSPTSARLLQVESADLLSTAYPKLFIAAEDDLANERPFAAMAAEMYELASEPKQIRIFPGDAHSMELFSSEYAEELHDLLLNWFQGL